MNATAEKADLYGERDARPVIEATRRYDDGQRWQTHQVVAPKGLKAEDLLEPTQWRAISARLRPLDRVQVVDDDASYFCEFLVTSVNPGISATLKPLRGVELGITNAPGMSTTNSIGAKVIYRGPHKRWSAETDARVLKDGFETADQANAWLGAHLRTVGGAS